MMVCSFSPEDRQRHLMIAVSAVGLAVLCSMDLSQLLFAAMGAATYTLYQAANKTMYRVRRVTPPRSPPAPPSKFAQCSADKDPRRPKASGGSRPLPETPPQPTRQPMKQPSSKPVAAPVFAAVGFDAQVGELLADLAVTAQSERILRDIVQAIERLVHPVLPEAKVVSFVNADLASGAAFRVAVPEVDIVICASPRSLTRLSSASSGQDAGHIKDSRKLVKSALRMCTDRLIHSGRFRFRRSAFRNDEPKVTLLASPDCVGGGGEAVPIEVSVNSAAPGFNSALLAECGLIDPRARGLALLVRRWAKDRGACHVAKGHLPPYAWTLLSIWFLQVGCEEGPLLPPVSEFEMSSSLVASAPKTHGGAPCAWKPPGDKAKRTVGELFKEFVRFYNTRFDFQRDSVSVWTGLPGAPRARSASSRWIEDPFDRQSDVCESLTEAGMAHLKEELARADALSDAGASLAELLEPWSPPESCGGGSSGGASSEG